MTTESASSEVTWIVRTEPTEPLCAWDWQLGEPPVRLMHPVRNPTTSAKQRHIAVFAYSTTTRSSHLVESGLEHDLVRVVDRDPATAWILTQPFKLAVGGPTGFEHTPDLLTQDRCGRVTVWDARPRERKDQTFERAVAATGAACQEVGWEYRVFAGLGTAERLNLLWLHGSRLEPTWFAQYERLIREGAAGGAQTLGDLFALKPGDGRARATVWHLLWRGDLLADLTTPLQERTRVALAVQ